MAFRNQIKIYRRNLKNTLFPKIKKTQILSTNQINFSESNSLPLVHNTRKEWNLKNLIKKALQKKQNLWKEVPALENAGIITTDWASHTNVLPHQPKYLGIKTGIKHFARNELCRLPWTSPLVIQKRNFMASPCNKVLAESWRTKSWESKNCLDLRHQTEGGPYREFKAKHLKEHEYLFSQSKLPPLPSLKRSLPKGVIFPKRQIHTSAVNPGFVEDGLTRARRINPIIEEECYLEKCKKLDEELDVGTDSCPKTPECDTPENRKKYCKPRRHHTWGCEIPPPNDAAQCTRDLPCYDPKKVPVDSNCKPKYSCCDAIKRKAPGTCKECIGRMFSTSAFLRPRAFIVSQAAHYSSECSTDDNTTKCFKSSSCYQPEKGAKPPCPKFFGSICRAGQANITRECPKICLAGCKPPADRDYCPDQEQETSCITIPAPYLSFSEAKRFQFSRPPENECTLQEMRIFKKQVESAKFKDISHGQTATKGLKPADCNPPRRGFSTVAVGNHVLAGNFMSLASLLTKGRNFHTSSVSLQGIPARSRKDDCNYKPAVKKIDPCAKDPCVAGKCIERPHELCGHCIPLEFKAPCYEMIQGSKPDCSPMVLPPCPPKLPVRPCPPKRPPMSKPRRCGLPHGPAECLIDKCKRYRECCRDHPPPPKIFPCPQECDE